jgi:hypothetical protein
MLKKKYVIDKEIINSAKSCHQMYKCLEGDSSKMCTVDLSADLENNPLVILCNNQKQCNYKADYCSVECTYSVCTCPVRQEIYFKYQLEEQ